MISPRSPQRFAVDLASGGILVYTVNASGGGGGGGGTSSVDESTFTATESSGTPAMGEHAGKVWVAALDAARNLACRMSATSIQVQAFKDTLLAANGTATFTCTAIPAGKSGYLLRVDLAASGLVLFTIQQNGVDLAYQIVNAGSSVYEPITLDSDQCATGLSFDILVTNLTAFAVQAFATVAYDQF